MARLRTHFLPALIEPADLAGSRCVVIDVLRATTTIAAALDAGARAVAVCQTIEEREAGPRVFPRARRCWGASAAGSR